MKLVPWLQLIYSKGGSGIHAYATLSKPVEIKTRKHQKALGDAVCVAASRIAGIDVKDAKCCAGGNMWVHASGAERNGFKVIQEATAELDPQELPPGWREATTGTAKIEFAPDEVELEPAHLEIERQIEATGFPITYNNVHHCWHVHTKGLEEAAKKHGYKGFLTTATGVSDGQKPNAFMFALPGGGFRVHRFGDASEPDWVNGKYCFLNEFAPVREAFKHFARGENAKGYVFDSKQLAFCLTSVGCKVPELHDNQDVTTRTNKGKVTLSMAKQDNDSRPEGWVANGKFWQHTIDLPKEPEAFVRTRVAIASAVVRAVAHPGESKEWAHLKDDGEWTTTNRVEAKGILDSLGLPKEETLGNMRRNPYTVVCEPFQPEHLPGRRWNLGNAKYACEPSATPGDTETWDLIWDHVGESLEEGIEHESIINGAHYLQLWFAILLRNPKQRLPYLYFFSNKQASGKTTLGLAASRYLIHPGAGQITAETVTDKFTGELEDKVLCLIEEVDLTRKGAYARIKNLITAAEVSIRKMRTDTYLVPNISHFIHTANDPYFVPVESEDTRIVIGEVQPLAKSIPEHVLHERLKAEAPFMLRKLLDMEIPEPLDPRLWLPVLNTPVKEQVIAGTYDSEPSDSEQSVMRFYENCLKPGGQAIRTAVWNRYGQFMRLPRNEGIALIARNSLLPTLKKHCHLDILSS